MFGSLSHEINHSGVRTEGAQGVGVAAPLLVEAPRPGAPEALGVDDPRDADRVTAVGRDHRDQRPWSGKDRKSPHRNRVRKKGLFDF